MSLYEQEEEPRELSESIYSIEPQELSEVAIGPAVDDKLDLGEVKAIEIVELIDRLTREIYEKGDEEKSAAEDVYEDTGAPDSTDVPYDSETQIGYGEKKGNILDAYEESVGYMAEKE